MQNTIKNPYEEVPHEEVEQRMVVEYLEIMGHKFTAIPNSTHTKSWKQKRKNKDTGLRKGLPDMLIIINGRLVFIEMKRIKGGSTSREQKEWIYQLNQCQNVFAHVCKGADVAIETIKYYENK